MFRSVKVEVLHLATWVAVKDLEDRMCFLEKDQRFFISFAIQNLLSKERAKLALYSACAPSSLRRPLKFVSCKPV
jgi:hypothetical protein